MIGGVQYLTSGGNSGSVSRAKERIVDSLLGLILIIGSYVVLGTVNPDLVSFRDMEMEQVEKLTYEVSPGIPENAPDPVDPTAPKQPPNVPPAKPTSGAMGSDNVPWFMQYDARWNPGGCIKGPCGDKATWMSDSYKAQGSCTSIAQRGCGTTSLAMVANFYGAGTDPMKTARWGLGCTGGWQPFKSGLKMDEISPGLKGDFIGTRKTDITERMNKVISYVNSGKPVIYNCNPCDGWDFNGNPRHYGGHYIVLTGYDASSKSFRVNDPGRGGPTRIRTITYDNVANSWVVAIYVHR
jgi:hypothetical protein